MNDERIDASSDSLVVRRRGLLLTTVALALAILLFALWSSERLPLTWDEGDAFVRAERVAEWFNALRKSPETLRATDFVTQAPEGSQRRELRRYFATLDGRRSLFCREALEVGFQHTIYREGHPAGYSLAIASGYATARSLRIDAIFSEKTAFRFGGILLFTFAICALFWRTTRTFGYFSGVAVAIGVTSCPRVFCHALIAGGDSVLISSWLLAWSFFPAAKRRTWGAVLWGGTLGISFSAKFSGFLLVAPFLFVFLLELFFIRATRATTLRAFPRLFLGLVVALTFFMVVNPPLWHDPIHGLSTFWTLNTTRSGFDIPIWFFNRLYSLERSLPIWNGFFWIVATVPSFLTLAALGTVFLFVKRRFYALSYAVDGRGAFVLTTLALASTLPVTRAFPGLPPHDGARLLIASVGFWGALGGLGASLIATWVAGWVRQGRSFVRIGIAFMLLAPGVADLLLIAPQYLSFYSGFVGGVRGATKAGLEPTYYWDSFDADVAATLRRASAQARDEGRPSGVLFSSFSSQTLHYYRQWETLPPSEVATISNPASLQDLTPYGFYVLQRRPGIFTDFDFLVMKHGKPILTKRARDPLPNPLYFSRMDTTILEVYATGDLFAAP